MSDERETLSSAQCQAAGGEGCGCSFEPYDCGAYIAKRWLCEADYADTNRVVLDPDALPDGELERIRREVPRA